jgi:hypothetical protein
MLGQTITVSGNNFTEQVKGGKITNSFTIETAMQVSADFLTVTNLETKETHQMRIKKRTNTESSIILDIDDRDVCTIVFQTDIGVVWLFPSDPKGKLISFFYDVFDKTTK